MEIGEGKSLHMDFQESVVCKENLKILEKTVIQIALKHKEITQWTRKLRFFSPAAGFTALLVSNFEFDQDVEKIVTYGKT